MNFEITMIAITSILFGALYLYLIFCYVWQMWQYA